jgi:heme exporter protein A
MRSREDGGRNLTGGDQESGAARLIECRHLGRWFGRRRALHDVDLALTAGEALAVVGPNGAGKTTLLRLLCGLMRPSTGEVRVLGVPVTESSARRAIGFLSHQSLLYDDLTLLENLTFAARLYGLAHPVVTARAALDAAGLAGRAADTPRRLSRGLLQRAAIARALLHRPRVLLLDEPFTGLDVASADALRQTLVSRLRDDLGVILVTHHLTEVWPMATRVAVLAEGRWVRDEPREGTVEEFLPRYRGLIGA